jgi:hypothetical protein
MTRENMLTPLVPGFTRQTARVAGVSGSARSILFAVPQSRRPGERLLVMRSSGEIGNDAFHRLEDEIDRLE